MKQSKSIEYSGHFVDDPDELLRQHPPQLETVGRVYGHHVTREFAPRSLRNVRIGKRRTLEATGYVVTPDIHVLIVHDPTDESITRNEHPHITIATAPDVSPSESNAAIKEAAADGTIIPLDPPLEIPTTEGYSDGTRVITR